MQGSLVSVGVTLGPGRVPGPGSLVWLETFMGCLPSKVVVGSVPVPALKVFLGLLLEVLASRGTSDLFCLKVDLCSLFFTEEELEDTLCCGQGEGLVTVREEEKVCFASFLSM